ncbi:carbohydrate ABC transporter permease [Clostridium algidicarnis]|uniref:Carbohydrate ABC transporter membrane protein 2 (CUT1 family) n=2 Tax=Clostridium algidicarnis TaxID=37659 RepID=A0A2S6FZK2_9CLOT|nr:carbohydrate ABC transporter permease [Clostridium algidicarnis]MBB6632449.1 carbohydrate ABC transporter permease [Clostridium algidicarnis]MBU3218911.1 carbohydrate ABC transporter permease [Clostridium algidicarnis]MCB2285959.1 carbohydrate ABC transporter permease [Clostridium algidicarnis]PPK48994.1 carbohydrate ABC transporter membrane protein 2 (CUT1 family) [Clostridium algidicarnis DSM 15099]
MLKKVTLEKVLIYIVLIITAVFILTPFIWILLTALKSPEEVFANPPVIVPSKLQWQNFIEVFKLKNFSRYFLNSVVITIAITAGELITTILAAFAFSNLDFKGKDIIFTLLIGTMMVPGEVLLIPNFVTLSKIKWINTYKALIIPWCTSVTSIFFLRQYFLNIPKQLYYAAKVDNCSDFKYLIKIVIPIARPAIFTIAILKIINSWNSFMWPLIMTNSEKMRTLPIILAKFSSEVGMDYHMLMAASTIIITPMIIIFIFLSKYIINGVSKGGIKG